MNTVDKGTGIFDTALTIDLKGHAAIIKDGFSIKTNGWLLLFCLYFFEGSPDAQMFHGM